MGGNGELPQPQLNEKSVVLPAKLFHRCLVRRQFLLEERLDFLLPQLERHHAHPPAGQPPHPLGQVEAVVVEPIRHFLLPAERLAAGQQHQLPGTGATKHLRLEQGRTQHGRLAKRRFRDRRLVAAWLPRDEHFTQRHRLGLGPRLPAALAVLHLANTLACFPGALGIGAQAARYVRMLHRELHPKRDRLGAEQPLLHAQRLGVRVAPLLRRAMHQAQ